MVDEEESGWEVVEEEERIEEESAEEERADEIDPHVDEVSNPGTVVLPLTNNAEAVPFPNAGMELLLLCLTNPLVPLPLILLLLLSNANEVDKLDPSPCVVGGQNRTREFDRDRRGLISSNEDEEDVVRGCDRPRDRCDDCDSLRRPLDCDDCLTINSFTNPSPTDPTTFSSSSPLRLFNALQTELAALEQVLLLSKLHIGHESNNAFHSLVRGDNRCNCTKGWDGHRPCESVGGLICIVVLYCIIVGLCVVFAYRNVLAVGRYLLQLILRYYSLPSI